jgi:hypothetical protein
MAPGLVTVADLWFAPAVALGTKLPIQIRCSLKLLVDHEAPLPILKDRFSIRQPCRRRNVTLCHSALRHRNKTSVDSKQCGHRDSYDAVARVNDI